MDEVIDIRTSFGDARVSCQMLASRLLAARCSHAFLRGDAQPVTMPAGTLYFSSPDSDYTHELLADGLFAALVRQMPPLPRGNGISVNKAYLDSLTETLAFVHECGLISAADYQQVRESLALIPPGDPEAAKRRVKAMFRMTSSFSLCRSKVAHLAVTYRGFANELHEFLNPARDGEAPYDRLCGQRSHAAHRRLQEHLTAHGHHLGMIGLQPLRDTARKIAQCLERMAQAYASHEPTEDDLSAARYYRNVILDLLARLRLAFEVETRLNLRLRAFLREPEPVLESCVREVLMQNAARLIDAMRSSGIPTSVQFEAAGRVLVLSRFDGLLELQDAHEALGALRRELLPLPTNPSVPPLGPDVSPSSMSSAFTSIP